MERRNLVGRRYVDYLKNNIVIELTGEELLWQIIYSDPRYNPIVERRKSVRRKSDNLSKTPFSILNSESSFALSNLAYSEEPFE